jgi:superfamily II DNA or RNA helicase
MTSPKLLSKLNHDRIKPWFDAGSFKRGMDYWETGHVRRAKVTEDGAELSVQSSVSGSRGLVYHQEIEIYEYENLIEVSGECTCPVGINCKHVVAVLCELIANYSVKASTGGIDQPVDEWLDKLSETSALHDKDEANSYPEDVQERLLYLINPEPASVAASPFKINASVFKTRQLKKGGFGKPGKYSFDRFGIGFYFDDFVLPADKLIGSLVGKQLPYSAPGIGHGLEGELAELALQKMLETGRCYWKDFDAEALSIAAERSLEFDWQEENDGSVLHASVVPAASHIFRVDQFWYVDAETGQVGKLQYGELDAAQLNLLLDAPLIPKKKLEDVSRHLILDTPAIKIPLPVKLDIRQEQVKQQAPVVHLRLIGMELEEFTGLRGQSNAARLSFKYGDIECKKPATQSRETHMSGNTAYILSRDIELEKQAQDLLREQGLIADDASTADTMDWYCLAANRPAASLCWYDFIQTSVAELKQAGWEIEIDDSFGLSIEEAGEWHAHVEVEQGDQWFNLKLGVDIDGDSNQLNLLPVLLEVLQQYSRPELLREALMQSPDFFVQIENDRLLKLDSARMLTIFDTLLELYDSNPLNDDGELKLNRHQAAQMNALLENPDLHWHGAAGLQELNRKLRDFEGIRHIDPPVGLKTELRDYQRQGLNWLQFLREFEFNGILADDMGLGKTVQTLAHLLLEKESGRMQQPCLIIVPTSLVSNWAREARLFAPELNVLILHGSDRHDHFDQIENNDIVITTYPLLRRDSEMLQEHEFYTIVLDESQFIKNPKSKTTQVVFTLKAKHRLCLTGTPLENHLGELWSMFHFLMPGFLGGLSRFNRLFRNPIEKQANVMRQEQLRQRIKPFLLRRSKQDVASELPKKTEIIRSVSLQGKQRDLYESIRMAMDVKVRQEISNKGLSRSHIMILDALLKLRQVCCDPRTLSLNQAKHVKQSAKLELLMDMLPEMIEEGRRILIFSQFTRMLSLIEDELKDAKIDYCLLTGQTRKRDEQVDRFQTGEVPVFLISLKAGGVGLNLTAADTVIHYDPWWNPAAENQATDRAHRIGQDKPVFVYKLIAENTIEDRILDLQKNKQALADSIYDEAGSSSGSLTADDLSELFKPIED